MSHAQLARDMAQLADDPLSWVLYAYPWGEAGGELERFAGPDVWQVDFLDEWGREIRKRGFDGRHSVMPIRFSTKAGHGVGKSGLVAWVTGFIMSTRPNAKGIVTANSAPQLETKTWTEIAKWARRCITRDWFKVTSTRGNMRMVHRQYPETWRCDAMAWRKEQPEAFAGQHAVDSTSFYIFDEASAIERNIFETADGGLTDGEPMEFLFGNPTRNSGYFYDTHHKLRHIFKGITVDSRDALIPNKAKLAEDIATYGIDSDYVRVRVLGQFPAQSSEQFIGTALVDKARKIEARALPTDPLIYGLDVARKAGGDESTLYKRRGKDCRTMPPLHLRPNEDRKAWTMQLAGIVAEHALREMPDAIFVDGGGIGGAVIDRLDQLGIPNVVEVLFGGKVDDRKYKNRGSYMYGVARDWLEAGGAIPDDEILAEQLTNRMFYYDKITSAIMLEPKEDISERIGSPDRGDGFVLTFAYPVGPRSIERTRAEFQRQGMRSAVSHIYQPEV